MKDEFKPANAEEARPSRRRVILFLLIPAALALVAFFWLRGTLRATGQVEVHAVQSQEIPARKQRQQDAYANCWQAVQALDPDSYEACADSPEQRMMAEGLKSFYKADLRAAAEEFSAVVHGAAPHELRRKAYRAWVEGLFLEERWVELVEAFEAHSQLRTGSGVDEDILVLAQAFADAPAREISLPGSGVEVAMSQALTGQPGVAVQVNGRESLWWIDTGAGLSVLTTSVAEAAGVEFRGERAGNVNDDDSIRFRPALVNNLRVGAMKVLNEPVAVIDDEHLRFSLAGFTLVEAEGIMGWPLLSRLAVELDFADGAARFARPGPPAARRNFFWSGYPVVELLYEDGTPLLFGLDTGAQTCDIRPSLIRRLGLSVSGRDSKIGISVTGRERVEVEQVFNLNLYLGDRRLHFPTIATGTGMFGAFFLEPAGRLGSNIGHQGALAMDYRAGRFAITH